MDLAKNTRYNDKFINPREYLVTSFYIHDALAHIAASLELLRNGPPTLEWAPTVGLAQSLGKQL